MLCQVLKWSNDVPLPHRRRCSSRCWATCTRRETRSRRAPAGLACQTRSKNAEVLYIITYVLWPAQGNAGDARDPLQPKTEQRLTRLALRARLDLVERGLGGGILLMVVVVVVVMIVIVIMLVLGVVGVDFLDGGRHLYE